MKSAAGTLPIFDVGLQRNPGRSEQRAVKRTFAAVSRRILRAPSRGLKPD
jgi:hypothetical protein